MRIVFADDNFLVRAGTGALLETVDGVEIVASVADAEQLLTAVAEHSPDVVLTDIRMPPTNTDEGIRAAKQIRAEFPDTGVVVLSQFVEEAYAFDLLKDGAEKLGYLLKERIADLDELVRALDAVNEGGSFLDPKVVEVLVARKSAIANSPLTELTDREREVLSEMATGKNNYFNPGKSLVRFAMGDSSAQQVGTGTAGKKRTNGDTLVSLPNLVDANGQPILAWQLDESARLPIDAGASANTFVGVDSTVPSRFYWGSNAGILRSAAQGKLMLDSTKAIGSTSPKMSLLTEVTPGTNHTNTGHLATLMALTGQPGAPNPTPDPRTAPASTILPGAPRGKIVFQAPGADGVFLAQGQGARMFVDSASPWIYYGIGIKDAGNSSYTGPDGKPTSINFLDKFDDIVQAN